MRLPRPTTTLCTFALGASLANATTIPPVKRDDLGGLKMRGIRRDATGAPALSRRSYYSKPVPVGDFQDITYTVNVTLGGTVFPVQLDTGSADFWVLTNDTFNHGNVTDLNVTVTYGVGQTTGNVSFTELKLGDQVVKNQAYILPISAENPVLDTGAVGIIGVSFDFISNVDFVVRTTLGANNTQGATPTTNIFTQDHKLQRFFDIFLERDFDEAEGDNPLGTLFIGKHAHGYDDVAKAPKIPRQGQNVASWVVAADNVVVNGKKNLAPPSSLAGLQPGSFSVLLDSGTSLAVIDPGLVDDIYSTIPGAVRFNDSFSGGQWIVPCNASTEAAFTFGGQQFPVHPLDLSRIIVREVTDNGKLENVTYCSNTYQYCIEGLCGGGLDGILGDTFLKNVYASFAYGDDDETLLIGNGSFVQLFSVTEPKKAQADFLQSRNDLLAQLPPALDPAQLVQIFSSQGDQTAQTGQNGTSTDDTRLKGALEDDASSTTAPSNGPDDSRLASLLDKYGPVVIGLLAGNLVVLCLLCIIGVVACTRGIVRGGAKARTISPSYAPVRTKEAELASDPLDYRD